MNRLSQHLSTTKLEEPDKSQAVIGVQMAAAYVGTLLMPPLFGLIANNINVALLPFFLLLLLILMFVMHEKLIKDTK
ncbi:MAG: hypothetical protein ACK5L6_08405 [Anaerorhabdus sp.]|uniref:hypothetical protein n=1 Tax=Anaerorhabdus sp. TaxID=1872524 RepID=UPI003A84F80A